MKTVVAVGKIGPVDTEAPRPLRVMEIQHLKEGDLVIVELGVINLQPKDTQ